jgi:murein DD-endopeptidase MepM/ murein hydrolase activator NlpD
MARRLSLLVLLGLLAAAPAGADTLADKKQALDLRIGALSQQVGRLRAEQAAVQRELAAIRARIEALTAQVGDVSARLAPLERELELRRARLGRLEALLVLRREELQLARRQYALAVDRLNKRLVGLYETEEADALGLILSAASFSDLLDTVDYLRTIGEQDKRIAEEVARRRRQAQRAVLRTRAARAEVRRQTEIVALRVGQMRELRQRLVESRAAVAEEQALRERTLQALSRKERAELAEIEALRRASAELAARIREAQLAAERARAEGAPAAASTSVPSASGFVWPVSGPVTSPFGLRWGRMHEGIDIAAPAGAPVRAVAAGQVIYAGWMGGYGNLVVVDHGGGLATAYAHLSAIDVSVGTSVEQGQALGAVGSTGHSFGPHLHFEVRIGGRAVDPLGYL